MLSPHKQPVIESSKHSSRSLSTLHFDIAVTQEYARKQPLSQSLQEKSSALYQARPKLISKNEGHTIKVHLDSTNSPLTVFIHSRRHPMGSQLPHTTSIIFGKGWWFAVHILFNMALTTIPKICAFRTLHSNPTYGTETSLIPWRLADSNV